MYPLTASEGSKALPSEETYQGRKASRPHNFDIVKLNWQQHLLKQADDLLKRIGQSSGEIYMSSADALSLSADGCCGPFKFINMCVTDSLLMASFCLYLKNDKVRSLFSCNSILRAAMVFLGARMYDEAKACWVFAQFDLEKNPIFQVTTTKELRVPCFVIDAKSEQKDHLNIFNELVLGTYHFDEDKITQEILIKTLSKFEDLGDVRALGTENYNPAAIIVDVNRRLDTTPPLTIYDDYGRVFKLLFLEMYQESFANHAIVGLFLSDRWVLYDDLKPTYKDFKIENADFKDDFVILVAGYVNIPKDESDNVPFGISEEGQCGTVVFNPARHPNNHEKEHLD